MNKALFTSKTHEWETPIWLFEEYNRNYNFMVDVCATKENAKCSLYWDREQDGLKQDWHNHICWMNPPYGRKISKWVKKAYEESRKGALVVCLLPARTDTKWFHEYIYNTYAQFIFLAGRLKFSNSKNSAPFPSMIIIFNKNRSKED